MMRTFFGIITLLATVLWFPLWVQLGLFFIAVIVLKYRIFIIIPALVADILYAPTKTITPLNFKMTLLVIVFILVWLLIIKQTRLGNYYVSYKK